MNSNNFPEDSKSESIKALEDFEENMKVDDLYRDMLNERQAFHDERQAMHDERQALHDERQVERDERQELMAANETALRVAWMNHLTERQTAEAAEHKRIV